MLIAILLPALGQARYVAKLALCGTQLKQMGIGLTTYATDYNGYYPSRGGNFLGPSASNASVNEIASVDGPAAHEFDIRPKLKDYFGSYGTKIFGCPLSDPIDYEQALAGNGVAMSSYNMWFGWTPRATDDNGDVPEAIEQIDDRMTWNGNEFNILVADYEANALNPWADSAHPDRGGGQSLSPRFENDPSVSIRSDWSTSATVNRGLIDLNYLDANGSVQRLGNVAVDDSRCVRLPQRSQGAGSNTNQRWTQLPPE